MPELWACVPGVSERGEPEADLEAGEWDGGDAVPAGAELWGGGNRAG